MKVNNSYFITYLTGAFPDKNQRKELSKLSKIGHGQYHRLFYQIDQYTQEVKVNSKALILKRNPTWMLQLFHQHYLIMQLEICIHIPFFIRTYGIIEIA